MITLFPRSTALCASTRLPSSSSLLLTPSCHFSLNAKKFLLKKGMPLRRRGGVVLPPDNLLEDRHNYQYGKYRKMSSPKALAAAQQREAAQREQARKNVDGNDQTTTTNETSAPNATAAQDDEPEEYYTTPRFKVPYFNRQLLKSHPLTCRSSPYTPDPLKVPIHYHDRVTDDKRAEKARDEFLARYDIWKQKYPAEYQRWKRQVQRISNNWNEIMQYGGKLSQLKLVSFTRRNARARKLKNEQMNTVAKFGERDVDLQKAIEEKGLEAVTDAWLDYSEGIRSQLEFAAEPVEKLDLPSEAYGKVDRNIMVGPNSELIDKIQSAKEQRLSAAERALAAKKNKNKGRPVITNFFDKLKRFDVTRSSGRAKQKNAYEKYLTNRQKLMKAMTFANPNPQYENPFDFLSDAAFVRPPLLPGPQYLENYILDKRVSSTPNIFSALHRFLHFERLRQALHFVRTEKKNRVREEAWEAQDANEYIRQLIDRTPSWSKLEKSFPFLAKSLYAAAANVHKSPWSMKEKLQFLDATHRHIVKIGRLMHTHFSTRSRARDSWILSYPLTHKRSQDDAIRKYTDAELNKLEKQFEEENVESNILPKKKAKKQLINSSPPSSPSTAIPASTA